MLTTPAIANLIRENKTFRIDSSIQTGKKYGMQLLDEHLFELYRTKTIAPEEAMDKARNAGDMQEKIEAFERGAPLPGEKKEPPADAPPGTAAA
jgi:twitching motility protein PilT